MNRKNYLRMMRHFKLVQLRLIFMLTHCEYRLVPKQTLETLFNDFLDQ